MIDLNDLVFQPSESELKLLQLELNEDLKSINTQMFISNLWSTYDYHSFDLEVTVELNNKLSLNFKVSSAEELKKKFHIDIVRLNSLLEELK